MLGEGRLANVLLDWYDRVVSEFGISRDTVFCSVTDAGPDVRRMCSKLLNKVGTSMVEAPDKISDGTYLL